MQITIKTIPHADQRYPTVGDWVFVDDNNLQIRVSDLGDRRYNALVAVHELVEALLCQHRGITTEMVDAFDMAYEAKRPEGNTDEPGNDPNCPCLKEHEFATTVEMLLAEELGVDWGTYDDAVTAL